MFGVHSEGICRAIDAVAPSDTSHVGVVLSDVRGNVLVLQPHEPKFGVTATLPRWKRERCEPTSDVLKQCLSERVGIETQLRRLRQEDETCEADFFPIPCSDSEHDSVWWGIVLSHDHDKVLAQRMVEEPPTVNDLANLLAEAMRRPLVDFSHRPQRLYLRARPEWAELLPHLKQVGIEVVSQEALPKWDRNFGDLQAQVEQARAALASAPSRKERHAKKH